MTIANSNNKSGRQLHKEHGSTKPHNKTELTDLAMIVTNHLAKHDLKLESLSGTFFSQNLRLQRLPVEVMTKIVLTLDPISIRCLTEAYPHVTPMLQVITDSLTMQPTMFDIPGVPKVDFNRLSTCDEQTQLPVTQIRLMEITSLATAAQFFNPCLARVIAGALNPGMTIIWIDESQKWENVVLDKMVEFCEKYRFRYFLSDREDQGKDTLTQYKWAWRSKQDALFVGSAPGFPSQVVHREEDFAKLTELTLLAGFNSKESDPPVKVPAIHCPLVTKLSIKYKHHIPDLSEITVVGMGEYNSLRITRLDHSAQSTQNTKLVNTEMKCDLQCVHRFHFANNFKIQFYEGVHDDVVKSLVGQSRPECVIWVKTSTMLESIDRARFGSKSLKDFTYASYVKDDSLPVLVSDSLKSLSIHVYSRGFTGLSELFQWHTLTTLKQLNMNFGGSSRAAYPSCTWCQGVDPFILDKHVLTSLAKAWLYSLTLSGNVTFSRECLTSPVASIPVTILSFDLSYLPIIPSDVVDGKIAIPGLAHLFRQVMLLSVAYSMPFQTEEGVLTRLELPQFPTLWRISVDDDFTEVTWINGQPMPLRESQIRDWSWTLLDTFPRLRGALPEEKNRVVKRLQREFRHSRVCQALTLDDGGSAQNKVIEFAREIKRGQYTHEQLLSLLSVIQRVEQGKSDPSEDGLDARLASVLEYHYSIANNEGRYGTAYLPELEDRLVYFRQKTSQMYHIFAGLLICHVIARCYSWYSLSM